MARNDVLIIGAGPSGLIAAAELARHGVDVRLIEQEVRSHRQARATGIQPGTVEILDSVGLLPPFLEAAEHIRAARVYGPEMSELRAMTFEGIDCRCEFECSLLQYETQRILEAHLASLGGVVERGVTATKVEPDGNDVLVDGRRSPDPPRRPHRLPVFVRRRGSGRGTRPPPLLVSDSAPDRRSGQVGKRGRRR